MHACTGLVAYCKRIGLLFKGAATGVKLREKPLRLGAALQTYRLRADLSPTWDSMDMILQAASNACQTGDFVWPTPASSPDHWSSFASKAHAFLTQAWGYASQTEYGVLNGLRKMMYVASHSCPEDVFDKLSMSTLMKWAPDENKHCKPLEGMSTHQVRKMFNLSPLWITCHTCFLESVDEATLKKVWRSKPGTMLFHAYKAKQENWPYMSPLVVIDHAFAQEERRPASSQGRPASSQGRQVS